jgi:hypothetical protein
MTQYSRDYVKMISQMTADTKDNPTWQIFRAGRTFAPPIWGNLFLTGKDGQVVLSSDRSQVRKH